MMMIPALALASLLPAVPLPPRLPADVDDALSLRFNPAGLGFIRGSDVRIVYGRQLLDSSAAADPDPINGLAAFAAVNLFGGFVLGGSYELDLLPDAEDPERGTIGVGFGGPSASFGVVYERVNPGATLARTVWNAGLTLHLGSYVSVAGAVRDIGEKIGPRTWDLGLALRPGTDRATLSARWRIIQGREVFGGDQDLAGRLELEPLDGLFVGGGANAISEDGKFEFGIFGSFRLALETFFVGTSYQDTTVSSELTAEIGWRRPPRPSILARRRVAVLELEGDLAPDPSFNIFRGSFDSEPYGALPLLLDEISRTDRILGLYLRIGSINAGWAKSEETRNALLAIRAAGKRVDCELLGAGDGEYFIASACSSITISPAANLEVNGVAANVLFYGGALDKLGVDVDVVRRGRYKSAPESFTRTDMSPEQREALGQYIDQIYSSLVEGIASGRKMDRAKVEDIIARGVVTATEAVDLGMVDKLLYPDEVDKYVDELYGYHVSYADAGELATVIRERWGHRPRIAIVNVDAVIAGGESKSVPFLGKSAGAETIAGALELARNDSSIRAVVLRVDSPGGDALASDVMARAVQLLEEQKPVIVSFGDTAASGGYYIAAPARAIYAEPTTLTGSIGVFMANVSVEKLLAKLGISADTIERGPLSNMRSIFRPHMPEAHAAFERDIEHSYKRFLETVAKGRKKKVEEVREVAEGRIWSGAAAKTHGLVDELGGLVDALRRAKREVGLDPEAAVELVSLPTGRGMLPLSVRTSVADSVVDLWPKPEASATLDDLVPHDLARSLAPVLIPSVASGREAPLALPPFALDID